MTERSHRFALYMLLAAFACDMFFGDVDLGPFSARAYLYAVLLGWMVYRLVVHGDQIPLDDGSALLMALYALFVCWCVVAYLFQGVALVTIATTLFTYHAIAAGSFLLILFIVRNRRDLRRFVGGLTALVLFSSVVALLQAFFFVPAWNVWYRLRPQNLPAETGFVIGAAGAERVVPPGLYATSFTFGYYLAATAVMILAFFVLRRTITRFGAVLVVSAAVLMVQQRSAVLAVTSTCAVFLLVQFERGKRLRLVIGVIAVAVTLSASRPVAEEGEADFLGRYRNFVDVGRLQVASLAIRFVEGHPFVGGGSEYVDYVVRNFDVGQVYEEVVAPHNLFLNAAVFFGIPGLLIMCGFLVALAAVLWQAWHVTRVRRDLLGSAMVLAVIGYLINAQFHNASFVTGDAAPWWFVASVVLAVRFAPVPSHVSSRATIQIPAQENPWKRRRQ